MVDKPVGPSSFDVIRKIRKLSGIKKIGHAGTLDPLASGLLVICFGRYTKLAGLLTDDNKIYEAEVLLGITTSTDDAEGEVIDQKRVDVTEEMIKEALQAFVGRIEQRPPHFSAIKIDGQRSYKLARENRPVELKPRAINIFSLELNAVDLPRLSLTAHCSKGTYIRSLARDIGSTLGCGAHASNIRRISSGGFLVNQALDLDALSYEKIKGSLLFGKNALAQIEQVEISEHDREHIIHGRPFLSPIQFLGDVALATCQEHIVAIMRKENDRPMVARVI